MRLEPTRSLSEIEQFRASLAGRTVLVIGAGRSGLATLRQLAAAGASVHLADSKPREELAGIVAEVEITGAALIERFEALSQAPGADLIIPSPGVPIDHPALVAARENGIEVWGTLELDYRLCPGTILAITGTNGKGTTCQLLADMLARAGFEHILAGNIGWPLTEEIDRITPRTLAVVEVSSFQLESIVQFHPRVASVLNLTAEHLDRHRSVEEYARTKARIFENQTQDDFAVVNIDDERARALAQSSPARQLRVSLISDSLEGAVIGEDFVVRLNGRAERICRVGDLPLAGEHHRINALVAAVIARLAGAPVEAIAAAIEAYRPPQHHMQQVREIEGVVFINDSKASNPEAAIADLAAMTRPFVAIVGGRDKGGSFRALGRLLGQRARAVVLIGEAAERIAAEIDRHRVVVYADTLREAIDKAAELARPGDAVVMAPACSSFDMFNDYADRGEQFERIVIELAGE